MRRSTSIRRPGEGFTIIELIVVITIIAILVGMLLAGIAKFREVGPRVQTKAEIGEMGLAIESFKSTYEVKYLPTAFILTDNYAAVPATDTRYPAYQDSRQYLSRVWPKVSAANALPAGTYVTLDGNQAVVFFLGGTPPASTSTAAPGGYPSTFKGNRSGFLNSPSNPFNKKDGVNVYSPDNASQSKGGGAFFNFKPERLNDSGHYLDPYGKEYYYFSSRMGNDYGYFGIYAASHNPSSKAGGFDTDGGYGSMKPFKGVDGKFIRPDSFQIISAGKDTLPGPGGAFEAGIGSYSPGAQGGDDLANFHNGPLSSD